MFVKAAIFLSALMFAACAPGFYSFDYDSGLMGCPMMKEVYEPGDGTRYVSWRQICGPLVLDPDALAEQYALEAVTYGRVVRYQLGDQLYIVQPLPHDPRTGQDRVREALIINGMVTVRETILPFR